jgi:hypothetical protein
MVTFNILGIWVYEECRNIVIVVSDCEMIAYRPFWRHVKMSANKHWSNALFLVLEISFLIIFLCPEYSEIGLNSVPVTITKFKFKLWLSVVLPCGHVIERLFIH